MDFGLIGKSLTHSFSQKYFREKFAEEKLPHRYLNFELPHIEDFPRLLQQYPSLSGLNVTIPYKQAIIPYLDELSPEARAVGAVNTVSVEGAKITGHNTDVYGFEKSLSPLLSAHHKKAAVLGSGGASRAAAYVLTKLEIDFVVISRGGAEGTLTYADLTDRFREFQLIVNTTPLGTYPAVEECAALPFHLVNENYLFYDLVYNPAETALLRYARQRGAKIKNGLEMLHLQAEKAWYIWNSQHSKKGL